MLLEVFASCFLPLCSNECVFAPSIAAFPCELQLSGFRLHKPHGAVRSQRSLFSGCVCREVLRSGLWAVGCICPLQGVPEVQLCESKPLAGSLRACSCPSTARQSCAPAAARTTARDSWPQRAPKGRKKNLFSTFSYLYF